jgi:hypothetical protein
MITLRNHLKLWSVVAVLFWSCQSEAQRPGLKNATPEKIAAVQTKSEAKQLNLNPEKTKQLKSVNLKYAEKLKSLSAQGRLKENKKQLKTLREAQYNEVQAILNPEEFKQYKAVKLKQQKRFRTNMQQNMEKMKQRREEYVRRLGLSEEQLEQMKAIRMKYAEQKRALRQERKQEIREQLRGINDKQNKEVKAILSEEQYLEYLEVIKEQRQGMRENMNRRKLKKQKE